MGPSFTHLLCMWHIDLSWQIYFPKIKDTEIRDTTYKKLCDPMDKKLFPKTTCNSTSSQTSYGRYLQIVYVYDPHNMH